ncbi:MAG: hypothetical protein CMP52_02325 [Flavobacteriales bacterium]|nr:hypothetical protein [Candidatus Arcticimaribacter sp.]
MAIDGFASLCPGNLDCVDVDAIADILVQNHQKKAKHWFKDNDLCSSGTDYANGANCGLQNEIARI